MTNADNKEQNKEIEILKMITGLKYDEDVLQIALSFSSNKKSPVLYSQEDLAKKLQTFKDQLRLESRDDVLKEVDWIVEQLNEGKDDNEKLAIKQAIERLRRLTKPMLERYEKVQAQ